MSSETTSSRLQSPLRRSSDRDLWGKGRARGPASGSRRVFRGGTWGDYAGNCRASYRNYNSPGLRITYLGFRLLRTE